MMGAMGNSAGPRGGMIGMAAGGAVALLLYLWFLSLNFTSVGGDAVVGQGLATFYALVLLWLVVIGLVVTDRRLGGPSWPRRFGFWVVPLALFGTVGATDYPNDALCQFAVRALPLMAAAHPLLGLLPVRVAGWAQTAVLLPMAGISVYAIEKFVGRRVRNGRDCPPPPVDPSRAIGYVAGR